MRDICVVVRSLLVVLGFGASVHALSGADGFLVIPTASLLPHQGYQIEGTLGYHMSEHNGKPADRHPYVSGFRMGFLDRFELGVQYGERISLDTRVRITEEDGFLPAMTMGMRHLANSQEAFFYSVPKSERQDYAGEFFLAASLGNRWVRAHGGLGFHSGFERGQAGLFWGLEQKVGSSIAVHYEGFHRRKRAHHVLSLNWTFADVLTLSAGATEFHRYFVQDGEIGFHNKSVNHAESGYRAPGVFAAVTLTGRVSQEVWKDTRTELEEAKRRLVAQEEQLRRLQSRMDEFEVVYAESLDSQEDSVGRRAARTEVLFDSIVQAYQEDVWDIDAIRAKQAAFLEMRAPAYRFLLRTAQHPGALPLYRETAVRIMGSGRLAYFVEPLQRLLENDPDLNLRREAALSLGAIATPDAKAALTRAVPLVPAELRPTLEQILNTFVP